MRTGRIAQVLQEVNVSHDAKIALEHKVTSLEQEVTVLCCKLQSSQQYQAAPARDTAC